MLFLHRPSYRQRPRRLSMRMVVFIAIALVGMMCMRVVYASFLRDSQKSAVAFTVASGESSQQIAERLVDEGIIDSVFWFRMFVRATGVDDDIRAGVVQLIPGDRYADIAHALIVVSSEAEVRITIPEGYTLAQIGELVRARLPAITLEEWERVTGVTSPFINDAFVVSAQKPMDVDLEGYLFPDTYRFFSDATAEDVVERMLRTMNNRIDTLGVVEGDAQGFTVHELLTLASIIEREVQTPDAMREVSDIFLKRLDIDMALQSDATVNYVTGGKDPSLSLTDRDLETPYNTYLHPGLPPGPISNPGMNALRAVWHPAENAYYYFLTDADGTVHYAETHNEHVQNKARFL